jgi:ABC-type nitrate/sulfonate/bicarbonate transport system substrate-binding protein
MLTVMRLVLSVSAALAVALTACGGAATPAAPTSPPAAQPTPAPPTAAPVAKPTSAATPAPTAPQATAPAATEKVNFRFDWTPTPQDVPVLAAQAQGFFRDAGVDVTTTVGSGSGDSISLTGVGKHDMAIANAMNVAIAAEQGIPVVSVGMILQDNGVEVFSLPENPVKVPQDLVGKKMAVNPTSNSSLFYRAMLTKAGIDPSKITEVPVSQSDGDDLLLQKQVDACVSFRQTEGVADSKAYGKPLVFMSLTEYGVAPYGQALIANKQFVQQHPNAVKGFLKAYAQGIKWSIDHKQEALQLLSDKIKDLDKDTLQQALDWNLALMTSDDTGKNGLLYQNPTRWQTDTLAFAKQVGIIKKDVDPASAYTNEYLPTPPVLQPALPRPA